MLQEVRRQHGEMETTTGTDLAPPAGGIGESFDPLGAHLQDPFPFYARARAEAPVFFAPRLRSWCVAGHADIMAVLRDHQTFSSREIIPRPRHLPADFDELFDWFYGPASLLGFTDEPEHTPIRAVVNTGFAPKVIGAFVPQVRRTVASLLDGLATRDEFDAAAEFAHPLSMTTVLDLIGIPAERHESFIAWNAQFFPILTSHPSQDLEPLRNRKRIFMAGLDELTSLVGQRRAHPREDLISFMAHSETGGRRLTSEEVVGQVLQLLGPADASSSNLHTNAIELLLRRRECWDQLSEDGELTDKIISECMRYAGPVTAIFRIATAGARIGAVDIPAGSPVCLLWASANRDERVFDRPDEFRPQRSEEAKNIMFGNGIHYCVGAPLVRTTMRIGLCELRRRLPDLHLAPSHTGRYRPLMQFRVFEDLRVRP